MISLQTTGGAILRHGLGGGFAVVDVIVRDSVSCRARRSVLWARLWVVQAWEKAENIRRRLPHLQFCLRIGEVTRVGGGGKAIRKATG